MSPRAALTDPDLAFTLSVMRGHDEFKRERFQKIAAAVGKDDSFGLNRIYQALRLLCEDD